MDCSPPGSSIHRILQAKNTGFVVVQSLSPTPHDPMDYSMPGFPIHHSLLKLAQTHVHRVGDAIQNHSILLSSSSSAFNLSQHQGFSNESALPIRRPKYWSFSFSISPSNEYSGLISFRVDQFDLLEVQGTLKSLLQHHSSKAFILRCSVFFMVNSHIHTYWKYHSFDYMDLCQQSNVSLLEYWIGLLFPTPVDLPDPRIEPGSPASPALAGSFFTTAPPGKPIKYLFYTNLVPTMRL